MEAFLHQVLSGLATGGIYASLALALVMIYQSTHHINFAQGEMAMFSTYLAWSLIDGGISWWLAFVITVAASFAGGMLIERVLIRPVEHAPLLTVVIVFIGLLVILNSVAGWIFSYTIKSFPSPFPAQPVFGGLMSAHELGAIGVTLWCSCSCTCFFSSLHWVWPCARWRRTRSRAAWPVSAWGGCSRSAGASPRRSVRSPV